MENKSSESRKTTLSMPQSVILLLVIIAEIVFCVRSGLNLEIPLFMTWLILWIFSKLYGLSWKTVEGYILDGVRSGFQSVMIVAAVGLLIGTWILCGCIPTMIYYGLALVSPSVFLPATLLLCSILSVMTGTSYGSAASAGLACMGIGISMGFPPGLVAGAVISGALFGDKMSPFSDTTNLAPAMAGSTLFGHIRAMFFTTIPAWIICFIIYAVIGSRYSTTGYDPATVTEYMNGLAANFSITPAALLPIVIVILLLLIKVPALPTILLGAVIGAVTAMVTQGATWLDCFGVMKTGFKIESGIFLVDKLLNRGGISSMYNIMMIMIFAMGMGNALDKLGVLSNLIGRLTGSLNSVFKLVFVTMIVSYLTDAIGCTQSMSHVVTGKLMNPVYREKGVDPRVLSRTMEDAGTLGGALIPWHTNAVYFAGTLGVLYSEYIPWVLLCFIVPVIALILAATGKAIWYIDPETGENVPASEAVINRKG